MCFLYYKPVSGLVIKGSVHSVFFIFGMYEMWIFAHSNPQNYDMFYIFCYANYPWCWKFENNYEKLMKKRRLFSKKFFTAEISKDWSFISPKMVVITLLDKELFYDILSEAFFP